MTHIIEALGTRTSDRVIVRIRADNPFDDDLLHAAEIQRKLIPLGVFLDGEPAAVLNDVFTEEDVKDWYDRSVEGFIVSDDYGDVEVCAHDVPAVVATVF